MALTNSLQYIVIWLFVGIAVIGVIVYILYRILRVVGKADKYFDAKMKESKQPTNLARLLSLLTRFGYFMVAYPAECL